MNLKRGTNYLKITFSHWLTSASVLIGQAEKSGITWNFAWWSWSLFVEAGLCSVHLPTDNPEDAAQTKGFRRPGLCKDFAHARNLGPRQMWKRMGGAWLSNQVLWSSPALTADLQDRTWLAGWDEQVPENRIPGKISWVMPFHRQCIAALYFSDWIGNAGVSSRFE